MPFVSIVGDICKDTHSEPVKGEGSILDGTLTCAFYKTLIKSTAKGDSIEEFWQVMTVPTLVSDVDYLSTQRVCIIVRDFKSQEVLGQSLYSLEQVCRAGVDGIPVKYNIALNHNGRKTGRLTGSVTLFRMGDSTPYPAPYLAAVKAKGSSSKLSAGEKLKLKISNPVS